MRFGGIVELYPIAEPRMFSIRAFSVASRLGFFDKCFADFKIFFALAYFLSAVNVTNELFVHFRSLKLGLRDYI